MCTAALINYQLSAADLATYPDVDWPWLTDQVKSSLNDGKKFLRHAARESMLTVSEAGRS